jgi:hypothetical protein
MSSKAILVVSEQLMKQIDENRGDLSRAGFIDFCIDSLLGEEEVGRPKPPEAEGKEVYVSREEFGEFKQSIKDLQKTFIDFFISYGLELGGKPITDV